jgi:hypothetical protein
MVARVLTRRELNRTLLARQLLLERVDIPILEAVEKLAGLQAQVPNPPYIGLWTRLQNFKREDLTQLMEQRRIVRAALMRSTLHLVTAEDHQRFRMTIQPALIKALSAFFGQKAKGVDVEKLVGTARAFLEEKPRTTGELSKRLLEVEPERDPNALAYVIRAYLPLVQVHPGGTWGSGSAAYATAESYFGKCHPEDLRLLLLRYLAAFGPASIMDFQAWAGMTNLKEAVGKFRSELVIYQDENGKELFDLPDMPILPADTDAPVRFIPEYDNLLLSHADRTRIIADEHRSKVFLSAGRVIATFLVDGFVRGTWKMSRAKSRATLLIEPFEALSPQEQTALYREGEALARFIENDTQEFEIQFK